MTSYLIFRYSGYVVMCSCKKKKLRCTAVENPFWLKCDPWPRLPLAMTSRSQGRGSVIVEGREDKEHMFQGGSHRRWPPRFLKTNNSPREVARSVSQKYISKQAFYFFFSFFFFFFFFLAEQQRQREVTVKNLLTQKNRTFTTTIMKRNSQK